MISKLHMLLKETTFNSIAGPSKAEEGGWGRGPPIITKL